MAGLAAVLTLAACGSGARQDAKEPGGRFQVDIPQASFPTLQRLAQRSHLVIAVHNSGTRTIPNVAVTICNVTCHYPAPAGEGTSVAAFAHYLDTPGLANHSRPVWVVDHPPGGNGYSASQGGRGAAFTADANTWALGSLRPGQTARFEWGLTAVTPGRYVVAWEVAAGLNGKAKAVLANGSAPHGRFSVSVATAPAQSYVNNNGQIVTKQ